MSKKKRFEDLDFSDGFLFTATLEDEELCRGDGTCRVFLNTHGYHEDSVPEELVNFLHFVEKSSLPEAEHFDPLLTRLHNRITSLKRSKKLEDRYMRFGEMLDDERKEGRAESIALIEAMLADGKRNEIHRLKDDASFLTEMLEYYHIAEPQELI